MSPVPELDREDLRRQQMRRECAYLWLLLVNRQYHHRCAKILLTLHDTRAFAGNRKPRVSREDARSHAFEYFEGARADRERESGRAEEQRHRSVSMPPPDPAYANELLQKEENSTTTTKFARFRAMKVCASETTTRKVPKSRLLCYQ